MSRKRRKLTVEEMHALFNRVPRVKAKARPKPINPIKIDHSIKIDLDYLKQFVEVPRQKQVDLDYVDKAAAAVKNKHYHWVGEKRLCKICKRRVPYEEHEI